MGAGGGTKQKYETEKPKGVSQRETTSNIDDKHVHSKGGSRWDTVPFLKPSPPAGTDLLDDFLKGRSEIPLLLPRLRRPQEREQDLESYQELQTEDAKRSTPPLWVGSPVRSTSTSLFENLNIEPSREECQDDDGFWDPIPEPLSWHGTVVVPSMEETIPVSDNLDPICSSFDQSSESVGQRHCRFGRCGCSLFTEDPSRSTCCATCSHGEMYHRSRTEAPLCRVQVNGGGTCHQCNLPIVGYDGFSGWYKEVQTGGDNVIVHDECYELYKDSNASKCAHCSLPIRKARGFSGRFSRVRMSKTAEKKKVHKECLGAFLESTRACIR